VNHISIFSEMLQKLQPQNPARTGMERCGA
jgi:hypothetical protein